MQLHDNINWQDLRSDYEYFLRRKLCIDISSVIVEGIVSDTDTWFIMESTTKLEEAINNLSIESEFNPLQFSSEVTAAISVVIGLSALALFYYVKH